MDASEIIENMSLDQKAIFVSGNDYWHLESDEKLGLPRIMITDGPHGLRKQRSDKKTSDGIGLGNSVPATCFPPASTSACSWDEDLLAEEGRAIAEECLKEEVSVLLGPGTNIKRSPLSGRNFEYFSEDPLLSGKMSSGFINGVQSKGIGTSLKHFACNSQEAFRMMIDEVVDERTIREIYFPAFEIAIKESQPWTIMNSYNKVNGIYSSQNERLLDHVARKEWGFKGLFVTDWGASVDRILGLKAGTDLEMPNPGDFNKQIIIEAVKNGILDETVLNERVKNVLDLILKSKKTLELRRSNDDCQCDYEEHHKIAQKVAENSMVLLKNENDILPIKKGQKIAIIGEMAKIPRFQGAGSSVINPTKLSNAFDELVSIGCDVAYAQGYVRNSSGKQEKDEKLLAEAIDLSKSCDVVIVFVGLTEEIEGEGYDKLDINLPKSHNILVSEIAKVNKNTVVVLAGGSVVCMPWINDVKSVLNSGLGGQAGGLAVANILTGKVNPSGKTAETYPLDLSDTPTFGNFPGVPVVAEHKESVFVGYRFYDTAQKEVLFPFGHGLSYTKFEYSDINIKLNGSENLNDIKDTDVLDISFKIKNVGDFDGAEVAQVYVSDKESTVFRPIKELRAFKKVFLKVGEVKEISLHLDKRSFAYYNVNIHDWHVETGEFEVLIGSSSRDIKLRQTVTVTSTVNTDIPDYRETAPDYYTANIQSVGDDQWTAVYGRELPPRERDPSKRIDLNCCLNDARNTKWGARICRLIEKQMSGMGSGSNAEGEGKMLAAMALQIPIRNFVSMSMGAFSPKQAEGLLKILNDDESSFSGFNSIFWRLGRTLFKLPKLLKSI